MPVEEIVPFRLDGRVAIVTGSGRGIGRSIATIFARAGAQVVVATRTASSGEETVAAIKQSGGSAVLETVDLKDRGACEALIEAVVRRFGRIDVLVHNAGVFPIVAIEDISEEQLEETLSVNLKAAFWLTKAAAPFFVRRTRLDCCSPRR